jgi:nondiscriminating glutamyl-tRNA synthetase
VFKSSFETLLEGAHLYRTLSDDHFVVTPEGEEALTWPTTPSVVSTWKELVEAHNGEVITEPEFSFMQKAIQEKLKVKGKELFQALRVAVIGKPHGTELKLLVPLMLKSSLVKRANKILEMTK